MTIDPQMLALLEVFGPIFFGSVATLLGVALSVVSALARVAWKTHLRRMEMMAQTLSLLAESITAEKAANQADHQRVWDTVQGIRAEIEFARRGAETLRGGLLEVTGNVKGQQTTIVELIEKLAGATAKLDAVFRFVDRYVETMPRRATDT